MNAVDYIHVGLKKYSSNNIFSSEIYSHMKTVLQLIFIMLCTLALNAQSSVNIQINHFLDGVQFQNETNCTNDLGNDFIVDRLQYYLSGVSIIHDEEQ